MGHWEHFFAKLLVGNLEKYIGVVTHPEESRRAARAVHSVLIQR